MQRRSFLRVIGGSAVGSGMLASGCSQEVPAEAIAAWRGPGELAAGADPRRWVLGWAILAPHSHNLQSWLVDLREPDVITLHCDRTRLLPVTDPFSRQIVMSQGTFIELLDLAARERGLRAAVQLFPDGAFGPEGVDDRPVARIRLVPDTAVARDPLFAQIPRRHTNREAYDLARPVPAEAWQAMADAAAVQGVPFAHTRAGNAGALAMHRRIAADAWKAEMTTPAAMLESFKVLRVGAAEVAQRRDGLTLMDPMVVWMTRLGLFDRSVAPKPDDFATRSQIDDFNAKIATTPGFLWMVTPDNSREAQVAAGRAYARVQLAATAHGLAMQPLQQALQEYPAVARPYRALRQALDVRDGQTIQMWARVG
ncbi:MAG: twin-arginine translocation pathway signal protein, partial [Rhodoferax sp.]|nr:twin-arginine translocation pathway signal protein [Rhodoferax sp.]